MRKLNVCRVQHLTVEYPPIATGWPAVCWISKNWMAYIRHMRADLMRSSRYGMDIKQSIPATAADNNKFGYRLLGSMYAYGHPLSVGWTAAQGCINAAALFSYDAGNSGAIGLTNSPVLKLA